MPEDNIFNTDDFTPSFVDTDEEMPTIIKVIGVGGGGCNAISHMFKQKVNGVSFVVCNTDKQAMDKLPVPTRLLLGPKLCRGLGAGNRPEVGRAAAEESVSEIEALFSPDTRMVFVTAGMGGGTGTGAAPVVARIAHEKGMLTIGIVTIPFLFEGEMKIYKALNGADEMRKYVDALMVINNERLTEIYSDYSIVNAFAKADDTLTIAARSISELITTSEAIINLDFNDVNTTLKDGGVAIISTGYGEGKQRVTKAIEDAINSPLLNNRDVFGSTRILVNLYFSRQAKQEFMTSEMEEVKVFFRNCTNKLDVITGLAYDDTLGEKVKVTVLAAGFNLTLSDDVSILPHETTTKAAKTLTPNKAGASLIDEPLASGKDRLIEVYGAEKVNENERLRAQTRYKILTPDEMDNDDVINELEKTPTLKRDIRFIARPAVAAQSPLQATAEDSTTGAKADKKGNDGEDTVIFFG